MKKTIFISIIAIGIAIACKKINDTTAPTITITAPTTNQMIMVGDSVLVAFTVSDEDLHEVSYLISTVANDTLFSKEEHTHGNYTLNQKFKTPNAATNMKLTITGEDHTGNTTTKSVNFHSM